MKVNRNLFRWARLVHNYAAIALLLLLVFFSFTGLTLNHPDWLAGDAIEEDHNFILMDFDSDQGVSFTPTQIKQLEAELDVSFSKLSLEQEDDLLFIDVQLPGRFIVGELDVYSGEIMVTDTRYGITAWLNDLHKGRHTGLAWILLLDISALLILVFSLTGLVLLLPSQRYLKPSSLIGLAMVGVTGVALLIS